MIARHLLLFLWSLLPILGVAQNSFSSSYKQGDKLFVCPSQGLSLREKASPDGKLIQVLPYGSEVIVQSDNNAKLSFTNSNISGIWAKVKYKDKQGYVFDGFLSRLIPMPLSKKERGVNDFVDFLKHEFKLVKETKTLPDKTYIEYSKMDFANGVIYESKTYEGGMIISVDFPFKTITFQEMFLLARQVYPEFFTQEKCSYQLDKTECDIDENASLKLTKGLKAYSMWWGMAD